MSVYELTGRKALVTGGGRGLGAGMAEALARAGAAIVIGDVREDLGKQTADALRQSGATAEFVPLDVTSDASWEQAIPQAISALGGLDILINNAGVEITSLLADIEAADIRRMLEVNVLGTALGLKHAFDRGHATAFPMQPLPPTTFHNHLPLTLGHTTAFTMLPAYHVTTTTMLCYTTPATTTAHIVVVVTDPAPHTLFVVVITTLFYTDLTTHHD